MEAFIQLTLFLILIILLSRAAVLLSKRFGLPAVSIQLLIGVLVGPSFLNLLGAPIILGTWGSVPPTTLHSILKIVAEIGLIQLMFLAGLQIDWRQLKGTLKPIFSGGGWGFLLTAAAVTVVIRLFEDRWSEALAMGAIMAASGFGISIYNFNEMRLLGSKVSHITVGASALSGLLAILMMIAAVALNYGVTFGLLRMVIAVSWFLGKLIMFFAIAYFLTSRFLNRVAKGGFEKRPLQMVIGYLLLVAALYAWAAMHFGSFAAVGVAALGGALPTISNLGLREKIEGGFGAGPASLPLGFLFVVLGMEVNLREMGGSAIYLVVLFLAVMTSKLIGNWIGTRRIFWKPSERVLNVSGTLHQGEMGILIAAFLFSRGLVNPSQFNVAISLIVILTMLTPILLKTASYSPSPLPIAGGSDEAGRKSRNSAL